MICPFAVAYRFRLHLCGSLILALSGLLALSGTSAQATTYTLGTASLLEGPGAGSDSVALAVTPETDIWAVTTNATWLHLDPANQNGIGSTNVVFSYDANLGATRTGSLTIASQTLTITQAGSNYVATAGPVTTLASSGLNFPAGIALDGAGNVYIADTYDNAIKKWTVTNGIVTSLVSTGLNLPIGLAVDGAGNVYIADNGNNAIKKWTATNDTVTSLVSSNLNHPYCVALDVAGNVYITDNGNNAIKKWTATNGIVTTLVSTGLNIPTGLAVDVAGNVYIVDTFNNAIKKWTAVNSNVTSLVSTGLNFPIGVAVDGRGNVYIADSGNNIIKKWTAANNSVTSLISSGLAQPYGVTVDSTGSIYIADTSNNAIKELPFAFVNPTARLENSSAGSDALPAVLPPTVNLLAPFAPTSDQPWLTISGITNGVVSLSFTANTDSNRTAHITLFDQSIPITQNVIVTPPMLANWTTPGNNVFQFIFSNNQGASFTVLSSTNLSLPLTNWTVVGTPTNIAPGLFQFTSEPTTNDPQRFYRVRSP